MARLHRSVKSYHNAEQYYLRAFATASGGRSEGDLLYSNACFARLATESDRQRDAMEHWFRASLHFAATVVPEAIAPRYAAMIIGAEPIDGWNAADLLAGALTDRLLETARLLPTQDPWHLSQYPMRDTHRAPTIVRAEGIEEGKTSRAAFAALGEQGWSVLVAPSSTESRFDNESHRVLRSILDHLIRTGCPSTSWPETYIYVVDDRLGREMAVDEQQQIEVCIRLGIAHSYHANREIVLREEDRVLLEHALFLRLGELVSDVEFEEEVATIRFKRYLSSRTEYDDYGLIAAAARGGLRLGDLTRRHSGDHFRDVVDRARALEEQRIVNLDLPEHWECLLAKRVGDGT
jgi:hypothetical protein